MFREYLTGYVPSYLPFVDDLIGVGGTAEYDKYRFELSWNKDIPQEVQLTVFNGNRNPAQTFHFPRKEMYHACMGSDQLHNDHYCMGNADDADFMQHMGLVVADSHTAARQHTVMVAAQARRMILFRRNDIAGFISKTWLHLPDQDTDARDKLAQEVSDYLKTR